MLNSFSGLWSWWKLWGRRQCLICSVLRRLLHSLVHGSSRIFRDDNAVLLLSSLPYTHPHITLLPTYSLLPGTPYLHCSAHSANPRWPPFPWSFPQPHLWRPLCHKITYSPRLCVRMETSFGTQLWGIVNSAYQNLGTNIAKRTTWKDSVSL